MARESAHWWNGATGPDCKDIWLEHDGELWLVVTREGGPGHARHVWPVEGGKSAALVGVDRFKASSGDVNWRNVAREERSNRH